MIDEEQRAESVSDEVPEPSGAQSTFNDGSTTESGARRSVELPVSTLVHLMGISTSSEMKLLEAKLDLVLSRLTALTLKVDRLSNHVAALGDQLYLDRIDFQLADIRTVMRKVFPQIAAVGDFQAETSAPKKRSPSSASDGSEPQGGS